MSNRFFVSLVSLALVIAPSVAGAKAPRSGQTQTPSAAAAPTASPPRPVCGLEGEIGEGRGRIVARGAAVGYRGELTVPLARTPPVTLKVVSDFAPRKPAVDRITIEVGADDQSRATRRLTGAFGERQGHAITMTRTTPPTAQDTAWFDALMAGDAVTASEGEVSTPLTYPAARFEDDYNYLLDLLQLTAGWEIAGLCVNRAPP